MKIQYCPVCMSELILISMITYQCPYCKTAFHISAEYIIEEPGEIIEGDNE